MLTLEDTHKMTDAEIEEMLDLRKEKHDRIKTFSTIALAAACAVGVAAFFACGAGFAAISVAGAWATAACLAVKAGLDIYGKEVHAPVIHRLGIAKNRNAHLHRRGGPPQLPWAPRPEKPQTLVEALEAALERDRKRGLQPDAPADAKVSLSDLGAHITENRTPQQPKR